MISNEYIIKDWAGNRIFEDETFKTFDQAEEFLCELFRGIGADYEDERDEFTIVFWKRFFWNRKH